MLPALLSFLLVFAQRSEPPILPQGWTTPFIRDDSRVEHISGASLTIMRRRSPDPFDTFTRRAVEGIARPLGFARIGEPRHFRDSNQRWVEYQVRGNRLVNRRRILYRAVRTDVEFVEIIYENSEDRFEVLLSEALSIASTLESFHRKERMRK